jgi:uncharacterized membrane protein
MSRSRPVPWLYRWSRPLIGGIATLGVVNTAFLTYQRFTASSCPTETCAVLASRYATVLGQPLSLFGLFAYLGMAILALAPLLINAETNRTLRNDAEDKTWWMLFLGSLGMLLFSGYLMNVMFSEFIFGGKALGWNGVCPFCLFSAICAAAMFTFTLLGRAWDSIGGMVMSGAIVTMFTLVTTLAIYAPDNSVTAEGYAITDKAGRAEYYVSSQSGEAETALAKHLKTSGASLYTSYTCPHCCEQKQLFGQQATTELPNNECNPNGKNANEALCRKDFKEAEEQTKQQPGFPAWKINGKYYFGVQKLGELAKLSGYQGPQTFKNVINAGDCRPVSMPVAPAEPQASPLFPSPGQ